MLALRQMGQGLSAKANILLDEKLKKS